MTKKLKVNDKDIFVAELLEKNNYLVLSYDKAVNDIGIITNERVSLVHKLHNNFDQGNIPIFIDESSFKLSLKKRRGFRANRALYLIKISLIVKTQP